MNQQNIKFSLPISLYFDSVVLCSAFIYYILTIECNAYGSVKYHMKHQFMESLR